MLKYSDARHVSVGLNILYGCSIKELPDPGGANNLVLFIMSAESFFPKLRSPFGQVALDLPCPEIGFGTLHLVPLVQLIPKIARWRGQTVIDLMLSSVL